MDAVPLGGHGLFLQAADGQHPAPQRDLSGHGDSRLDLAVGQSRQQRCSHGNTGGGAVLGHRSLWEMDVDVLGLIKVRIDPQGFRPAPQAGQSSLSGFLHHVAQITGQLQLAGTFHHIDLDL